MASTEKVRFVARTVVRSNQANATSTPLTLGFCQQSVQRSTQGRGKGLCPLTRLRPTRHAQKTGKALLQSLMKALNTCIYLIQELADVRTYSLAAVSRSILSQEAAGDGGQWATSQKRAAADGTACISWTPRSSNPSHLATTKLQTNVLARVAPCSRTTTLLAVSKTQQKCSEDS